MSSSIFCSSCDLRSCDFSHALLTIYACRGWVLLFVFFPHLLQVSPSLRYLNSVFFPTPPLPTAAQNPGISTPSSKPIHPTHHPSITFHMSDTNLDKLPKLTGSNYLLWVDQIKNVLMMSQLWMVVSGIETCPPEPETKPTDATSKDFLQWKKDRKEYMDWMNKSFKAAGILISSISPEIRVYIREDEEDPVKIWATLKKTFIKPLSAPRFQAYQDLFSIKKDPSETLDGVINRVDECCM